MSISRTSTRLDSDFLEAGCGGLGCPDCQTNPRKGRARSTACRKGGRLQERGGEDKGAQRLLSPLEEHICNTRDVVTKARL